MPVRSLNSSVFKWPDAKSADRAVQAWAEEALRNRSEIIRLGYFGSYARGDWGVGSDLDWIVILKNCRRSFLERPLEWDLLDLPVPAEIVIYTEAEWQKMARENGCFYRMISDEAVWVFPG